VKAVCSQIVPGKLAFVPGFRCKLLILWWAQQDSNLRLPPCEGGTLPLSYAPLESPQIDCAWLLRLSCVSRIASPLLAIKHSLDVAGRAADCAPGAEWG
jgi:hypothetical protein